MEFSFKNIDTEEEYKDFVEQFCFLVDKELIKAEDMKNKGNHHNLALILPKIISAVNIVGYLRGQDNMFIDFRPHVSFQNELYKIEGEFEKRLFTLIDYIKLSDSKDLSKSMIKEYYLKNRGFNE